MKILIDMNLSPDWCDVLGRHGHEVVHWSHVGDHGAADEELMRYASQNGQVVLTHDLDFSAILATTGMATPSVLQVRAQDVLPGHLEGVVARALETFRAELATGAIVSIDESRARVRVLPLKR